MASKKSKKDNKHKPAGGSPARDFDETRRRLNDVILNMMNNVSETYGDPERHQETRRECAAAIEAYEEYAETKTGYMFILRSKFSSDETVVVDASVDESMAAAMEAYAEYAKAITGDQSTYSSSDETVGADTFDEESTVAADLQSKYSSDEAVVADTFNEESTVAADLQSKYSSDETVVVEESTVAAEFSDPKTFANIFEKFVDKLNDMAGLLPVSKTGKAKAKEGDYVNVKVKVKEKERTTLINSGSDAKGSGTDGEKEDLVGLEEQLLKLRFQSLHQNNRYISSTFEYNGGINVSTNLGTDKIFCKY